MLKTRNLDLKVVRASTATMQRTMKNALAVAATYERLAETIRKVRTQAMQHDNIGELIREMNRTHKENVDWTKAARGLGANSPEELRRLKVMPDTTPPIAMSAS